MNRDREYSPAEIQHMKLAGIPADRDGLLGEYPRMMYKKGKPVGDDHCLATDADGARSALPIQGHDDLITQTVGNEDEELAAADAGWHAKIDLALKAGDKTPKVP